MLYQVDDYSIKSHNAAKSNKQKSKAYLHVIAELGSIHSLLDLGCGKLRYAAELYAISNEVTFVDSRVQLTRPQVIRGEYTTVIEYVKAHFPKAQCVALEDIDTHVSKYDLITCSNVLSAIPCKTMLHNSMDLIRRLLLPNGKALIVNQHKCSSFKRFRSGKQHLYGYLYSSRGGVSYYGIINKAVIKSLADKHGFGHKSWVVDDKTFAYLFLT